MGAAVFFGCAGIAFGPALALVLLTVAAEPLRVIVLVAGPALPPRVTATALPHVNPASGVWLRQRQRWGVSWVFLPPHHLPRAFFWLVSLLLASLIWFVSVHLSDREDAKLQYGLLVFGAAVSVLLQEVFRFAYFKLLKKADEGLAMISEDGRSPISLRQMAYVSGLSFGIISGVFSVINILADSIGPGIVGIHGDSPYYFITSAFLTMALVLLHTFWGVIFFDACEKRRYWCLGLVVASHLLTSGLTFLNPRYEASLVPIFIITFITGLWAFFTAGGSFRNILKCLS
ncbi:gamma-secretase subunit APH-1A isoform X2 [Strix aluco]